MDWTVMGAPPPTATPPMFMALLSRRLSNMDSIQPAGSVLVIGYLDFDIV
jgi:hypothetical protein